jgi:hypothetical protein
VHLLLNLKDAGIDTRMPVEYICSGLRCSAKITTRKLAR